jgi:hypothetical protein
MFLAKAIAVIATSPSLKLTFANRFLRYGPKIQVYAMVKSEKRPKLG